MASRFACVGAYEAGEILLLSTVGERNNVVPKHHFAEKSWGWGTSLSCLPV